MNDNRSLIAYSFGETWSLFKKNWEIVIGTFFLMWIILIFFGVILTAASFSAIIFLSESVLQVLSVILGIANVFLFAWITLRVYRIYLGVFKGEVFNMRPMSSQTKTVLNVILASLIVNAVIVLIMLPSGLFSDIMAEISFLAAFVLLVFLSIKIMFFDIIILDRGVSAIEGLKMSWEITKGKWWNIFGLLVLLGFLNVVGLLFFVVGIFVTAPFSFFAIKISAYKYLSQGDQYTHDREGGEQIASDPQQSGVHTKQSV